MIAAIAEEKKGSAIAAIIWKPLSSDRSDYDRWDRKNSISESLSLRSLRSLESGFLIIAEIAKLFFLSDRSDHGDRSDHMETRLKLRIFTKLNTFQKL